VQGRWKTLVRLGLAGLLAALGITSYIVDARWKQWPDNGIVLDKSDVVIASEYFPKVWRDVLVSQGGKGVAEALSRQLGDVERAVRLGTGVRPTPIRWKFWLGERVLFSHAGSQWLACARPGLFLRASYWGMQQLGQLELSEGTTKYGELRLQWREGYLLVSNASPTTPVSGPDVPESNGDTAQLHAWLSAPEASARGPIQLRIAGEEGLPIEIAWERDASPPSTLPTGTLRPGDSQADTWQPMVEVTTREGDLWERLPIWDVAAHLSAKPRAEIIALISPTPNFPVDFPYPKAGGDQATRQVLFDLVESAGQVLKQTGSSVYLGTGVWPAHPMASLALEPPLQLIPFAWGATDGFIAPVLGDDFSFGCALQGSWAHTANPPENLAHLLLPDADAPWAGPEVHIAVDWTELAPALQGVLQKLVNAGKLPGDPRAFEIDYAPWTQALEGLGKTELSSVDDATTPNRIRLRGHLAEAP